MQLPPYDAELRLAADRRKRTRGFLGALRLGGG